MRWKRLGVLGAEKDSELAVNRILVFLEISVRHTLDNQFLCDSGYHILFDITLTLQVLGHPGLSSFKPRKPGKLFHSGRTPLRVR